MKLIPTGIEDFKTIIDRNTYYIDKTELISDVLKEQVVLYTRPRRFGKTLNMSMLYYFFSNKEKENSYLFDGLKISQNKEALKHQNKYPTIFITLKEMKNLTFESQIYTFSNIIFDYLDNNLELLSSNYLTEATKIKLDDLYNQKANKEDLKDSLRLISKALYTTTTKKLLFS